MKFKKAVLILRRFQDWRRGYDCRSDAGIHAEELGRAIDTILRRHGMGTPLLDCRKCKNYDVMFGTCKQEQCDRQNKDPQ